MARLEWKAVLATGNGLVDGHMASELKAIRSLWVSNFRFVHEVDRAFGTGIETRLMPHIFEHDPQALADRGKRLH